MPDVNTQDGDIRRVNPGDPGSLGQGLWPNLLQLLPAFRCQAIDVLVVNVSWNPLSFHPLHPFNFDLFLLDIAGILELNFNLLNHVPVQSLLGSRNKVQQSLVVEVWPLQQVGGPKVENASTA